MNLVLYKNENEFALDLVNFSILDEKDILVFLKEMEKEKIKIIFTDSANGIFSCYVWVKSIKTIEEYEIIESISTAWAHYCNIDDLATLVNLKTCSLLSYSILKGLKNTNG